MAAQTFTFRAVDNVGAAVRGELEAESKQSVTEQLRQRGLVVLDIAHKRQSLEINLTVLERIKPRDLAVMTRQFSTMISSGLSMLRALYILEEQTESKKLTLTIVSVRQDVEAGLSLSDSLARHPKVFDPLYVAMVRAGETGGFLESTLIRVADQLEAADSLRRKVRSAMVYPAVVISFALIIMIVMIAFIVPVFAKIFADNGSKLPALTRVTVGLSDALRGYWFVIIGAVLLVGFLFRRWKSSTTGRPQWDRLRLRFPLRIGEIVQKIALARWSRTMSSLVVAGVPMLEAIDVTGKTSGNAIVERAMGTVVTSVRAGGTISAALRKEKIFPPMVTQMVGVGEETGALEDTLSKVADFYEDEVDAAVKAITSILEPAMIVVVGGIVGFVVISMYLPLFKVYDQIN